MRVLVTAVREGADPQDVMVTADDAATAADVAEALSASLGGPVPQRGHGVATQQSQAVPSPREQGAPLTVVVPLPGTVLDPRFAYGGGAADPAPMPNLWADGRRCDPREPAATVLRDGMRVSVDDALGPFMRAGEPTGRYELRVAGGPGAGRVVRLAAGVATIGTDRTCTLPVADAFLPPVAVRVTVHIDGRVAFVPSPDAQVLLDDEPIEGGGEQQWPLGGMLRVGDSLFVLDESAEPDAHLSATGEGGLAYNRPPRLSPLRPRARVTVPGMPTKGENARFQILASLIPLAFGLLMYFMTKQIYMLLFCLMSPVMMLGQWLSDARYGRKQHRKSIKQYRQEVVEHQAELLSLGKQEQRDRRVAHPDPAEILLFATGPRRRLWERRITDPDAMQLRLGVADLPSDVELVMARNAQYGDEAPEPPVLPDVPASLAYVELGVVGVAGDRDRVLGTARWLAVQAAALHSPRDLSLVVLSSTPESGAAWSWTHWLPHTAPQQGQDCVALLGADSEVIAKRVNELLNELGRRKAASEHQSAYGSLRPDPYILLVLDGARLLRRMPGVPQLLQEGPRHGIFALCIDEDERLLPEECRAAICWSPQSPTRVHLRGSGLESVGEVLVDQVALDWCELVARSLAPVRDVSRDDADSALPTAARLLSMLEMPDPTGVDIERIWRAGGSTTAAPIGIAADGPFVLDIRRDGPHALVAGTTGAGKSELLQTIIASLAVVNRPDALNYVLIDYKGGSAFQDCARLPHTVGMVSDLDAHLTERALASLAAELKRREEILFEAGAKDIEDYNDTRKLRPELEAMPRLVLVIDEFASLVAELPDFIAGLVDIARRGRSLGVHLVLATQRPAGVVSADIRANTNLRIALRVTDASESSDVIDAPDAGAISKSTPGRAYVRSGAQSLVGVQSARIGGRRPSDGQAGPKVTLAALPWSAYGRPLPRVAEAEDDGTMVTDLAVLVDAVRDGAAKMGFGTPRSPWLPPLPTQVALDELPEPEVAPAAAADVHPAPFGLTDLPAEQNRKAFALDLVGGEHTMLVGGPRSGRSTALRTLAGSLAQRSSPGDVHLYAIDCASNALLPLVGLPHVGAVVTRDQPDRVRRLIDRLLAEVSRRQQMLAMMGASSAAEQRASAPPEEQLPWMVVLLDGWEGFTSTFESYNYGQLIESMQRLFREGASVGMRVVMTADRSGLSGQVSSVFGERLVLRLADPSDYSTAGFQVRDVPKDMPPGRALRLADHGVEETQLGLLAADPSGQAQVKALRRIGHEAEQRSPRLPKPLRPMRVDALPGRITAAEAMALDPDFAPSSPLWTLLGVGGDELQRVGVDLQEMGPGLVIAGPPKSGRSTVLVGAARSLLRCGTSLVLITPRRSPLRDLAGEPGVLGVLGSDSGEDDLEALLRQADGPYAVVVDDAELLYDEALDDPLEGVLRSGMDGDHAVIAAGTTDTLSSQYRGFVTEARKTRNGVLLMPQSSSDGELFNIRLPANSGSGSPGSGVLVRGGEMMPIQGVLDE
ncbi:FtsK/SpoIIIE domain-containing protein [Streptomyces sp. NPDC005393]|uniref:FtsK/SpoIIIE domain-containing protein n=1 Tax=Streptomyces sp. NPDC005393 TaxID=3157041 RepID=UPI0033AB8E23